MSIGGCGPPPSSSPPVSAAPVGDSTQVSMRRSGAGLVMLTTRDRVVATQASYNKILDWFRLPRFLSGGKVRESTDLALTPVPPRAPSRRHADVPCFPCAATSGPLCTGPPPCLRPVLPPIPCRHQGDCLSTTAHSLLIQGRGSFPTNDLLPLVGQMSAPLSQETNVWDSITLSLIRFLFLDFILRTTVLAILILQH
jgi:hypothetical protein